MKTLFVFILIILGFILMILYTFIHAGNGIWCRLIPWNSFRLYWSTQEIWRKLWNLIFFSLTENTAEVSKPNKRFVDKKIWKWRVAALLCRARGMKICSCNYCFRIHDHNGMCFELLWIPFRLPLAETDRQNFVRG